MPRKPPSYVTSPHVLEARTAGLLGRGLGSVLWVLVCAGHAWADSDEWVDEARCQGCHVEQSEQWRGSHHQRAMQAAIPSNVLGDFNDVRYRYGEETTRFFRKGDEYWVNTPDAHGKPADFKVAYTFGVEPLQQYLLQTDKGHLQALGVAWDTQKKAWFHLYPDDKVDFRSPLHWTKPQQNANFMCIECHTTGFKRHFDSSTDGFASHWQALGVGCQSCHGPASKHLLWAQQPDDQPHAGFTKSLRATDNRTQVETCARCHSRRSPLGDGFRAHLQLMDDYLPNRLTPILYELDGQIKDEVFEYGSFTQSRMFAAGVACSDCHNPHSGTLKFDGDLTCLQCHNPAGQPARPEIAGKELLAKDYQSPTHHHHAAGSTAARCTSCHMPGKLYMVNDLRHDHSFSVPNPAQALRLGTQDACLGCHAKMDSQQLVQQFQAWYPTAKPRDGGYSEALALVRGGQAGAMQALRTQLARDDLPAIRRATLLDELPRYPAWSLLQQAQRSLGDREPQVRVAAIEAMAALLPATQRVTALGPLLTDPVQAVRLSAAYALGDAQAQLGPYAEPWKQAIGEYEQAQLAQVDRAEANVNLAQLYQLDGRLELVEPRLRTALRRDPDFLPARVALVQWLANNARGEEGRELLRKGIEQHPQAALLHHTLGLLLVREGQREEGLSAFNEAVRLEPDNTRYRYVLAIALAEAGQRPQAIDMLEQLLRQAPADREALLALVGYLRQAGEMQRVSELMASFWQINPEDPLFRMN
ncbi:tetratricopeptide repeat protein [Pseudomonas sp. I2]|uniref:tetratricopeptide repeat protein n=1 Tax=Pseudomonas sp. I2 TaxID=1338438 RepID=UPI0034D49701